MPDSHPVHNYQPDIRRDRVLGIIILAAIIIILLALATPILLAHAATPDYPYPGPTIETLVWIPLVMGMP